MKWKVKIIHLPSKHTLKAGNQQPHLWFLATLLVLFGSCCHIEITISGKFEGVFM